MEEEIFFCGSGCVPCCARSVFENIGIAIACPFFIGTYIIILTAQISLHTRSSLVKNNDLNLFAMQNKNGSLTCFYSIKLHNFSIEMIVNEIFVSYSNFFMNYYVNKISSIKRKMILN